MDSEKNKEQPKKCFCARCFLPVDPQDKVEIEGQCFHTLCSTCCICRNIPTSLKMFYGHVFCNECFKTHVLSRFRGESPRIQSNSWWMQWGPGVKPPTGGSESNEAKPGNQQEEPAKKCFCSRCLQAVDEGTKVDIGGQSFHPQCAKCYFCHKTPTDSVKIYYGQVFCEECFNKHILNRGKDNPSEFFKTCFDQWQNNAQFAEQMREFLGGNKDNTPFIFMMQGAQPPFCRCGTCPQEWTQNNEPKKSATPVRSTATIAESLWTGDLSHEHRTETSEVSGSCNESAIGNQVCAAEKIEKLTKYLKESDLEKSRKKWKNFDIENKDNLKDSDSEVLFCGWVSEGSKKGLDCPPCLWQRGPVYVDSDFQNDVCCGDVLE